MQITPKVIFTNTSSVSGEQHTSSDKMDIDSQLQHDPRSYQSVTYAELFEGAYENISCLSYLENNLYSGFTSSALMYVDSQLQHQQINDTELFDEVHVGTSHSTNPKKRQLINKDRIIEAIKVGKNTDQIIKDLQNEELDLSRQTAERRIRAVTDKNSNLKITLIDNDNKDYEDIKKNEDEIKEAIEIGRKTRIKIIKMLQEQEPNLCEATASSRIHLVTEKYNYLKAILLDNKKNSKLTSEDEIIEAIKAGKNTSQITQLLHSKESNLLPGAVRNRIFSITKKHSHLKAILADNNKQKNKLINEDEIKRAIEAGKNTGQIAEDLQSKEPGLSKQTAKRRIRAVTDKNNSLKVKLQDNNKYKLEDKSPDLLYQNNKINTIVVKYDGRELRLKIDNINDRNEIISNNEGNKNKPKSKLINEDKIKETIEVGKSTSQVVKDLQSKEPDLLYQTAENRIRAIAVKYKNFGEKLRINNENKVNTQIEEEENLNILGSVAYNNHGSANIWLRDIA